MFSSIFCVLFVYVIGLGVITCVNIVPAFYIKLHMIQHIWTERGPFLCDFSVVEFL